MKGDVMRISLIGFGAVGQGVARALLLKGQWLERRGVRVRVVAIADSRSSIVDDGGVDLHTALRVKEETGKVGVEGSLSVLDVIREVEHELVVEVTPTDIETGEPGLTNIRVALEQGRHVVTSNKGPFIRDFNRLIGLAGEVGVMLRYEATVGGAMPIINLIQECLAGNSIQRIEGIFNGTCNYILTRMAEEGLDYKHVLSEAQELGIAEADPSYDVMGIDAACKLVILANTAYGNSATFEDVSVTGITQITPQALELAERNGYTIRLIGEASEDVLSVAPKLVPKKHPLSIGGTLNLANIHTDLSRTITVSGAGAGSIETASAVLSDIINIYKHNGK